MVVSYYSDQRCLIEVVIGDAHKEHLSRDFCTTGRNTAQSNSLYCLLHRGWDGLELVFMISKAMGEISNLV